MTVKDGIPYVDAAVRSVLAQTFTNFELIVVDDGSTDATPAVLARLTSEDPRVRILTLEANLGAAEASNRGLEIAWGEFAARLDADDLANPRWLETEHAFLKARPDIDIVGASSRTIRSDGTLIKERSKSETPFQVRWLTRFRWPFVHSTIMFRREGRHGRPSPRYDPDFKVTLDYDFCARLLADGKGANLADILVSRRVHDTSMSHNNWVAQRTRAGQVARQVQKREFPEKTYRNLGAFRAAYYDLEPHSSRLILRGLRDAIRHELPTAAAYHGWMCREALVLYLLAMRHTGKTYAWALATGFLVAPGLVSRAVLTEVFDRMGSLRPRVTKSGRSS